LYGPLINGGRGEGEGAANKLDVSNYLVAEPMPGNTYLGAEPTPAEDEDGEEVLGFG
jgi:hypothetical protein